ncbi:MAG: molybdopterin-guanine dinucleotide biosynthesis protein B [Gammaproteobacteria bacterium]|nr:molybdopterin-guanine dinucleotide biosynthesis protein B [Gammaproteobacteria bacterium]MDH5592861.1 molybdopterin-guanine dinucleotide biosynthesis protein B [Gammaproteobacteria bacterium]MDH5613655.1 molybdopterin-guanine dinucleotide biosynthesis protein B [Gammaproteobacteria bacterium]
MSIRKPPLLAFIAEHSNTGKTTLLEKVLPLLVKKGIRTAVIKHTHHDFETDKPGKDSYRLHQAGSRQTMLVSPKRMALVMETPENNDLPDIETLVARLDTEKLDLILAEGFKHEAIPKIEIYRSGVSQNLLCKNDKHIIAVCSDIKPELPANITLLDINKPEDVVAFICKEFNLP